MEEVESSSFESLMQREWQKTQVRDCAQHFKFGDDLLENLWQVKQETVEQAMKDTMDLFLLRGVWPEEKWNRLFKSNRSTGEICTWGIW